MIWKKKGTAITDYLIYIVIAIVVIVLGVFLTVTLAGKGNAAIDFVKDLLRFGE